MPKAGQEPKKPAIPFGLLIITLLFVQLFVLLGQVVALHGNPPLTITNDPARYHELANEDGIAYRDYPVEFPPLTLAAIELLDGPDVEGTATRLAWFSFAMQIVIVAALAWAWGLEAGYHHLVFTLPLVVFLFFRIDLLSVALAVISLGLVRRQHVRWGGVALAAAVLAKGWPLLLAPLLIVRRTYSALVSFAVALALGVGAWLSIGGLDGIAQVVTFRHAKGWQIYSTPGILTILFTGEEPRMDAGSSRVGTASLAARVLLLLVLGGFVVLSTWRGRRNPDQAWWRIPTANVAMLLFLAPIVSEQYVSWLAPGVALGAAAGDRMVRVIGISIALLTALILFPSLGPALLFEVLTLIRNLMLAGLALTLVVQSPRRLVSGGLDRGPAPSKSVT